MTSNAALTVGELRDALADVDDDMPVLLILGHTEAAWLARVRLDTSGFVDLLGGPHALDRIDDDHHDHTLAEIGDAR